MVTIKQLEAEIEGALIAHPKAHLLESLPRVGRLNLAQIIGEVGPVLDSAVDVDHACAQVGATPVTRESGKQRHVSFWASPRWPVTWLCGLGGLLLTVLVFPFVGGDAGQG